jgi:uncharacterized protein (DUF697 family)
MVAPDVDSPGAAPEQAPPAAADASPEQAPSSPADAAPEQAPPAADSEAPPALSEVSEAPPGPAFTMEMHLRAENCIKNHVIAALGIGVIPVPIVDLVGITALELRMIGELASIYHFPFPDRLAVYKVLLSLLGSTGPLFVSRVLQSLLQGVPLLGFAAAVGTLSATGGASVYAVGKVFQKHFESGGTFLGSEDHEIREYYRHKLREAKGAVKSYSAKAR